MLHTPPLIAFGIGAGGMLFWLAAAAAPILIHLWTKRRFHEAPWAAMDFLLAAIQKNAKRVRLEQWLLLLVRTLIVVCVVLAVSEPYWGSLGIVSGTGDRVQRVIVIDGSFSMDYRPGDKSRFERAKELAQRIAGSSRPGDACMLVLMADPPSVIIGQPAFDARDVEAEIGNLKLRHSGADVTATLGKVEEILKQKSAGERTLSRSEVVFVTDLGRNSWEVAAKENSSASDFLARLKRLKDSGVTLLVVDVGEPEAENLAVTSLRAHEAYATLFRDLTFTAQVQNFGKQEQTRRPVTFFVDGRKVREETINVPANGAAMAAFTTRFETPGEHLIEARLGSDLLEVDNHRWLSVSVKEQLRVLCIDGAAGGGDLGGATGFLKLALDPDDGQNPKSPVRVQIAGESALSELDLKAFDSVFLCNVGQFTSGEARILDNYLKQGGGLVIFLGDRVLAERYNRELGSDGPTRLLSAVLDQPSAYGHFRLNPLDYRHPIVSAFRGQETAGLLSTPIFKYYRLKLPAKSNAKVALAFDSGDPAIIEESFERGRVILCALPASILQEKGSAYPWTMFAKWPSFPPLVQDMLSAAVDSGGATLNVRVGQPLTGELPAIAANLTLKTPDGRTEPLRAAPVAGEARWSYPDTELSGVYSAISSLAPTDIHSYSVNVDPAESDLAKLSPRSLPPELSVRESWDNAGSGATGGVSFSRDSAHVWFLYSLLTLLLVESALAWWFGNRGL